jgi:PAS domain S-box-containing protein
MSSADRTGPIAVSASAQWLRTQSYRYGFALVAVCAALAAQRGLEVEIGFAHSFLLFYPTILIVSLLAGFWAGVTATLLCALASLHFYSAALNSLIVSDETEETGLALFILVGIAISWVAASVRERANRLQEFEKVVEGLEEMIVVVDRGYRCLIANRAFLNYPGMKREDLIGRSIPEILNPGVFETTIKDKLAECFRGKILQFEMRYRYPNRGERELVVAHFPIKGRHGVDRVASVLRDVTEQKEAEAALRERKIAIAILWNPPKTWSLRMICMASYCQ